MYPRLWSISQFSGQLTRSVQIWGGDYRLCGGPLDLGFLGSSISGGKQQLHQFRTARQFAKVPVSPGSRRLSLPGRGHRKVAIFFSSFCTFSRCSSSARRLRSLYQGERALWSAGSGARESYLTLGPSGAI